MKCDGAHGSSNDPDVFVRWAAEEFLAAGRAGPAVMRSEHRRRALFFTEIFRELNSAETSRTDRPPPGSDIGQLLALAFDAPRAIGTPSNGRRQPR